MLGGSLDDKRWLMNNSINSNKYELLLKLSILTSTFIL
jgi:hypothetical protein